MKTAIPFPDPEGKILSQVQHSVSDWNKVASQVYMLIFNQVNQITRRLASDVATIPQQRKK